ncbi:MAG: hypothetical protein ABIK31_05395 [candidate division WOR-3 bacterium]
MRKNKLSIVKQRVKLQTQKLLRNFFLTITTDWSVGMIIDLLASLQKTLLLLFKSKHKYDKLTSGLYHLSQLQNCIL